MRILKEFWNFHDPDEVQKTLNCLNVVFRMSIFKFQNTPALRARGLHTHGSNEGSVVSEDMLIFFIVFGEFCRILENFGDFWRRKIVKKILKILQILKINSQNPQNTPALRARGPRNPQNPPKYTEILQKKSSKSSKYTWKSSKKILNILKTKLSKNNEKKSTCLYLPRSLRCCRDPQCKNLTKIDRSQKHLKHLKTS